MLFEKQLEYFTLKRVLGCRILVLELCGQTQKQTEMLEG